ncbi:MAG TPA: AraC family transcriptional regulator [Opitutaceae bacterium]
MLRYLGIGPRQFGVHPLKPIVRMNWEFFAVVRGRCAPIAQGAPRPPLSAQTLWVAPPGSAHTWAGEGRKIAQVAVFHFGSVPAQLEAFVRERGQVALPLKPAECERVAALAHELQADFRHPNSLSNLVFQGAVIELALLVLRNAAGAEIPALADHAERTVESATRWFADNVRSNPSIVEVARQVHVSPSTLRRLFHRVLHQQPARAFGRIQIEKGMRLMTETKLKLDAVALECGYTSTSDFCRAFKAFTRVTPTVWRRTLIAPPRAASVEGKSQAKS